MHGARFIVGGRVQGVFYRASAREQALELGLTGHAKNLPDGRVEVLAFGSMASLDALEAWLRIGPPAAKVAEVVREDDIDEPVPARFETR
jgi:acylphosphatase